MAVVGHPRRMKMCRSSGRRRRFLGAESPLISLTWEPRAPRTVATSTRLRFLWWRLLRVTPCWRAWRRRGDGDVGGALRRPGRAQGFGDRLCTGARRPGWAPRRDPQVHHDDRRAGAVGRVVGQLRGVPGGDGVDWVLLEAGLAAARGPSGVLAAERGPPAQRPWAEDRCGRCRLDRPAGRARAGPAQLRAAPADPGAARADPLPQD